MSRRWGGAGASNGSFNHGAPPATSLAFFVDWRRQRRLQPLKFRNLVYLANPH